MDGHQGTLEGLHSLSFTSGVPSMNNGEPLMAIVGMGLIVSRGTTEEKTK